jgi:hypothetical protein
VEARRQATEGYSPLAGAFRRYELAYVIGDERDLVRVRTNFRPGNEVYLFRLRTTPEFARRQFLDNLKSANELREHPAWYNTLTTNCTTTIRHHAQLEPDRLPLDWRVLLNGHAGEYLYDLGHLAPGLPFAELKRRSHISPAARAASVEDFPQLIRAGRPGFQGAVVERVDLNTLAGRSALRSSRFTCPRSTGPEIVSAHLSVCRRRHIRMR